MDWDVFISHAWEDKEAFARPLAKALEEEGLRVWFDEFTLRVGDSLLHSIDHGLANSRYGIVILSPHFFAKQWTQKELAGLAAREVSGGKVILPVWHNVTADQVRQYSPTLADRVAVSSDRGLEYVVAELLRVIKPAFEPVRPPRHVPPHPTVMERLQLFEPEMILIPAGEFLMGSDPKKDEYAEDNEQPQHSLYLPDYYMAKTPVTNVQYAAFVQSASYTQPRYWKGMLRKGGKPPRGKGDRPVVYVSWYDAVTYCNWLAETTGKSYRLPSEAEWEKGARGNDGRFYPWGNQWDAERCHADRGIWADILGLGDDTTPVGAYLQGASPYGLLDMAGNVWEWTRSIYKDYPYNPGDGREDLEAKGHRVLRGGAFGYSHRLVRCAFRLSRPPGYRFEYLGFRVAMSLGSSPDSGGSNE